MAARLASGLFVAAEGVDYRLPELYGGDAAADVPLPSAYPAACRPQAWSAAAPLAAPGRRHRPGGRRLRRRGHPPRPHQHPLGAFSLRGLKVGEEPLDVHVDADGTVRVELAPGSRLSVHTSEVAPVE